MSLAPRCVLSFSCRCFFFPWETTHEQRNPNLLSSSPFAPRFLLENFYFDEHMRYIVTIYPVVILWLTGTLSNSDSPGSNIYVFEGTATPFPVYTCLHFSVHCSLIHTDIYSTLSFPLQLWPWLFPASCSWYALLWSRGGITNDRFTKTVDSVCRQWKYPWHKENSFYEYELRMTECLTINTIIFV